MSPLKGAKMKKPTQDKGAENAEAVAAIFGATPVDGRQSFHNKVSDSLTAIREAMDSPEGKAFFASYKKGELNREEYKNAIIDLIPDKDVSE